ncbi:MAG: hypothetical protein KBE30_00610 [Desulfobacter sp.]|nr:hypothetical protein [Desulfobacter sp.]
MFTPGKLKRLTRNRLVIMGRFKTVDTGIFSNIMATGGLIAGFQMGDRLFFGVMARRSEMLNGFENLRDLPRHRSSHRLSFFPGIWMRPGKGDTGFGYRTYVQSNFFKRSLSFFSNIFFWILRTSQNPRDKIAQVRWVFRICPFEQTLAAKMVSRCFNGTPWGAESKKHKDSKNGKFISNIMGEIKPYYELYWWKESF